MHCLKNSTIINWVILICLKLSFELEFSELVLNFEREFLNSCHKSQFFESQIHYFVEHIYINCAKFDDISVLWLKLWKLACWEIEFFLSFDFLSFSNSLVRIFSKTAQKLHFPSLTWSYCICLVKHFLKWWLECFMLTWRKKESLSCNRLFFPGALSFHSEGKK